jgi:hypothetical protein
MRVNVRTHVIAAGAVLSATAMLVAACGSDDGDRQASQPSTATVVERAPVTAAHPDQVLKFTAKEYSFEGPKTAPAGLTELQLTNTGMEDHQLGLFRLDDGVDAATVLGAVGKDGLDAAMPYGKFVAGPNGTAPSTSTSVVAELEPGKYVVLCAIPDPQGVPHVMKGMLTDLTVTAATGTAAHDPAGLPEVGLSEFHFDLPKGFDGSGPVVVVNKGKSVHEAVIARLADGKTVADVVDYESLPYPRKSAAPYTLVTGTTFVSPGEHARLDLDLPAGEYAWLCFLPGPKGSPHLALGMVHPFTVG